VRHEGAGMRRQPHRMQLCCTEDESRSLETAMQVEVSNHLKLLWTKAMVVSVKGKGRARPCQVSAMETNTNEPLIKCRKRMKVIKTRGESLTWDKFGGNLFTDQTVTGMEVA